MTGEDIGEVKEVGELEEGEEVGEVKEVVELEEGEEVEEAGGKGGREGGGRNSNRRQL